MKIKFTITCLVCMLVIINSCKKSKTDQQVNTQTNPPSCLPANLLDSLIAFYSFGSGSLNDISGNNFNLTNPTSAAPATDRAGNPHCAFSFDAATGDYLMHTNPAFLDNFQTIPFSISLWYKPATQISPGFELLVGRDSLLHCPDTYGQWSVALYDLRKAVFGINEYSTWQVDPGVVDVWKHLVVTCTGTDLKLYINSVLTTYTPLTGCGVPIPTQNIGDLVIGKWFTGSLDDIMIYKKVLSMTEITQLYNLAACCQ